MRNRIDSAVFRYIEKELYDYESTMKMIRNIKDDLRTDSGLSYETEKTGRTYRISCPTEDKALKVLTNKQLNKAVETVKAIDRARDKLDDEDKRLFHLRYRDGYNWRKIISHHMPMSERTYYRRRNRIVSVVAEEMGFKPSCQ